MRMTKPVQTPCCCVCFNMLQSKFGFQMVWSNEVFELQEEKRKELCEMLDLAKKYKNKRELLQIESSHLWAGSLTHMCPESI